MSVEKEQFDKVIGELRRACLPAGGADAVQAYVDSLAGDLARVEADNRQLQLIVNSHANMRDAVQAQLAEAVGLLEPFGKMAEGKDRWPETSGVAVFPLLSQVRPVRAFLKRIARHAQAEQQEAHHENA